MKSLEALNILKDSYHSKRDIELLNTIEEDLLALKILKESLYLSKLKLNNGKVFDKITEMAGILVLEEEIEQVKKCLDEIKDESSYQTHEDWF